MREDKIYVYYCPDLDTIYTCRTPDVKSMSIEHRLHNWWTELVDVTSHSIFLIGEL